MYRFLLPLIALFLALHSSSFAQCTSFSGTIRQGSQLSCGENAANTLPDSISARTFSNVFLDDQVLDANDTLLFFLTNREGLPNGIIHGQTGKDQRMLLDIPLELDTLYRIFAVVGNNNGNGSIDFTDPCLSISGSWGMRYSIEPPDIQSIQPILELSCTGRLEYDARNFLLDPTSNWDFMWTTGNIGPVAVFTEPGFYTVDIIHPDYICPAIRSVQVGPYNEPNLSFNAPDTISCLNSSTLISVQFPQNLNVYSYQWLNPAGIPIAIDTNQWEVTAPGIYQLEMIYRHPSDDTCLTYYDLEVPQGMDGCALVRGTIRRDTSGDCLPDLFEPVLKDRMVRLQGSQTRYSLSDNNGYYQMYYPANESIMLEIVSDHLLYQNCNDALTVTTPDVGDTLLVDLSQETTEDCPLLEVLLTAGRHRRCELVRFDVEWCNKGTSTSTNSYIQLELDPWFTLDSATMPFISLGNNQYQIQLGEVPPDSCGSFQAYTFLHCQAPLGATLCAEASIYPNAPCPSPDPQWNGSSIAVEGFCQDTSLVFRIENIGTSNMNTPAQYIVIEDGVMLYPNPVSFQLDALESIDVVLPANGKTYRLEAEQVPNHPGFSSPSITIEGCASYGSQGYLNQFPQDDQDRFIDISCREVIGSYDPNNKLAFPEGYASEHFIKEDQSLEYLIQFQNTGTDTAFYVMIEDVLDPALDMETFQPLQASHDYRIDISAQDTLRFVFEHIQLPDSTTDLLNSQGYIKFRIAPKANTPIGTLIRNDADIFFDQNEAVHTNEVFHTIGRDFILTDLINTTGIPLSLKTYPNPTDQNLYLELRGEESTAPDLTLTLTDSQGRIIHHQMITKDLTKMDLSKLDSGIYFIRLYDREKALYSGKIIRI